MDLKQFRDLIVRPALQQINYYSLEAEQLVMATAMAESKIHYVHQVGGGPARSFFQIEPATHDDIWARFISRKMLLLNDLKPLIIRDMDLLDQLHGNLFYSAAMCRIFYLRIREPLPKAYDWHGMARYWKKYYNTRLGKGTEQGFLQKASPVMQLYPRSVS